MKFSAQQEYGLRCMVHMARAGEGASVNIDNIAECESITSAYVAKLMRILRTSGLVSSTRGQHGGYQLARHASVISAQEILEVLGDRLYTEVFCSRHAGNSRRCAHTSDCAVRALWSGLDRVVESFLARCTLADLAGSEDAMSQWMQRHVEQLPASLATGGGALR